MRAVAALVLVALLAAGCAAADEVGSPSHRLRTWVDSTSFGQAVGSLRGDAQGMLHGRDQLAAHESAPNLTAACNDLATDAESANGNLPTPSTPVTDELAQAYQLYYDAGTACYASQSSKTLRRAVNQTAQAGRLLDGALRSVERTIGATVPTTTTTQPALQGGGF
jgi:hypothetical protein